MRIKLGEVSLQCLVGDISNQPGIDAVVNAANADLVSGGGVAGALHAKAGPELAAACAPHAPIKPGEAVLTSGFSLSNPYVIHCLGPVFGRDKQAAQLLGRCYTEALKIADERQIASVAFPAISTGSFGYPMPEAADVACATVAELASNLLNVRLVRFVLFDQDALRVFSAKLIRATGRVDDSQSPQRA